MGNEIGPVEYMIVAFPGTKFKGEIVPALADLVGDGDRHSEQDDVLTRPLFCALRWVAPYVQMSASLKWCILRSNARSI